MNYCRLCGNKIDDNRIYPLICDNCGEMYFDNPVPIVLVLIYNSSNEIITARKDEFEKDRWGLISGFIEGNETAEETAVREAFEETNTEIEIDRIVGTFTKKENKGQLIIGIFAKHLSGELNSQDDISDAKFISPYDACMRQGSTSEKMVDLFVKQIENNIK